MSNRLVELKQFPSTVEASIARGILEDEGIDVQLSDEGIGDMRLGPAVGGVRLIVREEDVERATAILASVHRLNEDETVDFGDQSEEAEDEAGGC